MVDILVKSCKECGGEVPKRETHTGGIQPFYCSNPCRLDAKRRFYREWRIRNLERERLRDRVQGHEQRERRKKTRLRWSAANSEAIRAKAKAHRREHHDRVSASDKKWRQSHPEAARNKARRSHATRRAVLKKVFVEHVDPVVVFERDKGMCGICKQRVERDSPWEIDHMIPISKGGAHAYANVQLSHQACNRAKRDTLPSGQPNLFQVAV